MPTLTASWRKIATLDTLQRSSHSLAVTGGKAYIFGGELKPRQPVDADVHVLDVEGAYELLVLRCDGEVKS